MDKGFERTCKVKTGMEVFFGHMRQPSYCHVGRITVNYCFHVSSVCFCKVKLSAMLLTK